MVYILIHDCLFDTVIEYNVCYETFNVLNCTVTVMNIEIKSRSIWVLGHWKATDQFRAHIYSVKKTQFHTLPRV